MWEKVSKQGENRWKAGSITGGKRRELGSNQKWKEKKLKNFSNLLFLPCFLLVLKGKTIEKCFFNKKKGLKEYGN